MPHSPVSFVSLGPGEAELITLRGLKALQAADCIFCPETCLANGKKASRAADILRELTIPESSIVRFHLPMSKNREMALKAYDKVYAESASLYKEGKNVCIVAEGDAGFYSSIHYVLEKLQADTIPVVHVAGVPAFIAAGAMAGIHIVSQEERLMVIPGIVSCEEIERLVSGGTTVVVMKLSQCTDEVHRCIDRCPHYHYHYFENVGTSREKYLFDKETLAALSFPYFSLLIVRA